jgi:hypothetical protein
MQLLYCCIQQQELDYAGGVAMEEARTLVALKLSAAEVCIRHCNTRIQLALM